MAGFFKRRNYVRNTLGLNKSDFNQRYQAALSATDGGTRHERRDAALKSLMNDYSVSQADDLNTDYYSSVENSARSLIEQKYPKKTNGNTNAAAATPAVTPATPGAPVRVSLPEYDMDAWRSHLADWKNYVLNGGDRPSTFNWDDHVVARVPTSTTTPVATNTTTTQSTSGTPAANTTPNYDSMSFDNAFATARRTLGKNGIFTWKGNPYTTKYKGE